MSEVMPEGLPPQAVDPSAIDPNMQQPIEPAMPPMARYSVHIPMKDKDSNEIPHVLGAVRQAMTDAGLEGRIVLTGVQGDWADYQTDELAVIMADAPDDPNILAQIKEIAAGAKMLIPDASIYITVQAIQTYIV